MSPARDYDPDEYDHLLRFIHDSVKSALRIISSGEIRDLGDLMHETWLRKRAFPGTTNELIDEAYTAAREAGATGGKILGAGAGGFMILVCPEEMQRAVRERLSDLLFMPLLLRSNGHASNPLSAWDPSMTESPILVTRGTGLVGRNLVEEPMCANPGALPEACISQETGLKPVLVGPVFVCGPGPRQQCDR